MDVEGGRQLEPVADKVDAVGNVVGSDKVV